MKQNDLITNTISNENKEPKDNKLIENKKTVELENSKLKLETKPLKREFLDSVYENFIFFLKNFNKSKKKDRSSASQKRLFARKQKIKKKIAKKKAQQSSYHKEAKKNVEIKDKSLNEVYQMFKDQLKPEDFAKIVEFMKINNYENISESIQRFPQHLKTLINLKKKENINHINTRKSESFLTYLKEKGKRGYNDIPSNCTHVKICYFIWKCQGNGDKDPTAIGRKIKKMALFVS